MPRGDKSAYSGKQKRKAEHIEEGYKERGVSTQEAERRAWATVNKQDGGAKPGPKAKHPKRAATKKTPAKKKTATKSTSRRRTSSR
jgi:plasmid stabilization system protein ParE